MKTKSQILRLSRKLTISLVLAGLALGAYATLGDGKTKKTSSSNNSILSIKTPVSSGSFTLRSGYNFRGRQVINTRKEAPKYITLNTAVTYQNGHTSYIVPLKKKVLLNDKITFNPNAATRH